jgi:leucine-rich repeat protein SHOC2
MITPLECIFFRISKVPEAIGNLVRLEELIASGNPLQTVPSTVGKLTRLITLELDGCGLTHLPEQFVLMTSLVELNLGNNNLKELPQVISRNFLSGNDFFCHS